MLTAAAGMFWLTGLTVALQLRDRCPAAAGDRLRARAVHVTVDGHRDQRRRGSDSGVASATVNTAQQVGGSIGTALLSTIAASATTAYITSHVSPGHPGRTARPSPELVEPAWCTATPTAFWWTGRHLRLPAPSSAGALMRSRPPRLAPTPAPQPGAVPEGAPQTIAPPR